MDTQLTYGQIFERSISLLGEQVQERVRAAKIIIFGVGGVGSWCAEGLVRSGVERLTLVDFDEVSPSNINRQRMADVQTVGRTKVEALAEQLLRINPEARITPVRRKATAETLPQFGLDGYDYIIDCIDSLHNKMDLMRAACATPATFFSSMGAARKIDPTRIRVGDFWKVRDCPLGAALRKQLRRSKDLPAHSFTCVYGDEILGDGSEKGSLVHITSIFGMTLAGLVLQDIHSRP